MMHQPQFWFTAHLTTIRIPLVSASIALEQYVLKYTTPCHLPWESLQIAARQAFLVNTKNELSTLIFKIDAGEGSKLEQRIASWRGR